MSQYFNSNTFDSFYRLKDELYKILLDTKDKHKSIIILCIGSDRSTGDCLGPLIGYKLSKHIYENITVIGTLANPVHAMNLFQVMEDINNNFDDPFIVAIDASLGKREHIGLITLGEGPLKPGLGVNKQLPDVGDIHITGIVNFSGIMENVILQTTRLATIMRIADVIYYALNSALSEIISE